MYYYCMLYTEGYKAMVLDDKCSTAVVDIFYHIGMQSILFRFFSGECVFSVAGKAGLDDQGETVLLSKH